MYHKTYLVNLVQGSVKVYNKMCKITENITADGSSSRLSCKYNIWSFCSFTEDFLEVAGGGVISIPEGDLFFFVYLLLLQGGVFYQYKKL